MKNTYGLLHCVKYSEVDVNYKMRLDYAMEHLQDITGLHSTEMQTDSRTIKEKSNAFWVLLRLKLRVHRSPILEQTVRIETFPTFAKGFRFGRDYVISADGESLISGTSEWCTLDCDTHAPRRAESVQYPHSMPHREDRSDAGEMMRIREALTDDDYHHAYRSSFTDIDANKHTNNIAYLRMTLNCFSPDELGATPIRDLQITFLSQTFYGDEIKMYKKTT